MPLATIQKVLSLDPITGADSIEVASVLGWKCVVRKGEFKVGDLGIYIEIDSIVPDLPPFAFLKDKHFRVRTARLRGQISQGLFMPLQVLYDLKLPCYTGLVAEGRDVTDVLGVKKYEKEVPASLGGNPKGTRPSFIPKTDEERIQSYMRVIQEIKGRPVYVTTKCDGSSCTFFYRNAPELEKGEFGVCSRSMLYSETDENGFSRMAVSLGIHEKMEKLGRNIAVQGELCGPGIQQNKMGLPGLQFFAFNAWDIDKLRYIDYEESRNLFAGLGLTPVPLIEAGKTLEEILGKSDIQIDDLLKYAEGTYANGSPREGIVIRPMMEAFSDTLRGRLSFKVINNKFLERHKE